MYKILACALIAAVAPAFANEGWMTNIDEAVAQAAKDNKSVLVEFTGSDWCGPCKMLKSQVFASEEFKKLADKDLVLVELDFPQQKELPAEQKAYNEKMSAQYGIEGFPTVYLLNSKGQPYWVCVGGGQKDEYLKSLEQGLASSKEISELFAKADKASGMEKAELLTKALNKMPQELKAHYSGIIAEIVKIDTKDTLGYGAELKKIEKEKAFNEEKKKVSSFIQKEIMPLFQEKKFADVIKKANEYMDSSKEGLSTEMKQVILSQIITQANMANKDIDGAVAALEKAASLDPKSEVGRQAAAIVKQIKTNRAEIEKRMKAE